MHLLGDKSLSPKKIALLSLLYLVVAYVGVGLQSPRTKW